MVRNANEMIEQKWWELAERAYHEWGYLVFCSIGICKVGYVFNRASDFRVTDIGGYRRFLLPQPFRIMGPGTREEYLAQGAFVGLEIDPAKVPRDAYFYRAVTE